MPEKKTSQDCAVVIAKGNMKGMDVTVGATNFGIIVVLAELQKQRLLYTEFSTQ